jgi:SAM domain (Sterile alpha motif)
MSTIAGWLERLGLAQYVPVFAENVVDTDGLAGFNDASQKKENHRPSAYRVD